jgi:hypothetical protein
MILDHPLFNKYADENKKIPDHFAEARFRATDQHLQMLETTGRYSDPLAATPDGGAYDKPWLARKWPVEVRKRPVGWVIIVQEAYQSAIGQTLDSLRKRLVLFGLAALAMVLVVVVGLWGFAMRLLNESAPSPMTISAADATDRLTPLTTNESSKNK